MPSAALPGDPPNSLSQPQQAHPGLARSAGILSIGNAVSRILGLVREMVIAYYFGASGQVSAFRVASQVPTLLYDLLVGGMLSAAMVPVLSDYAQPSRRQEFARLASALLTLFATLLALLVLLLEVAAPWIAWLLAGGFGLTNPDLLSLTTSLIRISAPVVWLFSMAGVVTALLFAQQRFTIPAIASAVYNLGIIVATPLLAARLGVTSLVVGILVGSLAQFLLMATDLRRSGLRIRFVFDLLHPALWRMVRLYLPIALGLIVSIFQIGLDRRLASGTGEQSIAWMSAATTLQQLPLGLISVAISIASLPMLSQYYAAGQEGRYRHTLGRGLRLVLLLIVPAAVGLWIFGEPLTRLLFERNQFTAEDTYAVTLALDIYVVGMLFAAVDFPLNFAFYARNNTLLPALVGVLSVVIYIVVAYALLDSLGYLGLVWADSAKQASHALVMIFFLNRRVGPLHVHVGRGLIQVAIAAALMAVASAAISTLITGALAPGSVRDLLLILLGGGVGLAVYAASLRVLGVPEARAVTQAVQGSVARFSRRNAT